MARSSNRRLRPPRPFSVIGDIIVINAKLAYAVFLVLVAWVIWPSSPEWWGFGFLAIIIMASAVVLAGKALIQAGQLILRDGKTRAYQRLGADPKTSDLASTDDLRRAGMLDG